MSSWPVKVLFFQNQTEEGGVEAVFLPLLKHLDRLDAAVALVDELVIGQRHGTGVPTEAVEHMLGTGERVLRIHDPAGSVQPTEEEANVRVNRGREGFAGALESPAGRVCVFFSIAISGPVQRTVRLARVTVNKLSTFGRFRDELGLEYDPFNRVFLSP